MSLSSEFNELSRAEFNPKLKIDMLEEGKPYHVLAFKWLEVKNPMFGKATRGGQHAVVAVVDFGKPVEKGKPGTVGEVFLPRRFKMVMNEQKIEKYNKSPDLALVYENVGAGREYVVRLESRSV